MSAIHAPRRPKLGWRTLVLLVALGAAIAIMLLRLWYLQVVISDDLAAKAASLRTISVKRLAPRGLIYDRNKVLVAGTEPKWVVTARPFDVGKNPWVVAKVARLVGVDESALWKKIRDNEWRPHFPTPIYIGANLHVATKIAESGSYLPGIDVETQVMRRYSDTTSFAHILGHVWIPYAEDVERNRQLGIDTPDFVGKDGLERQYEALLQGTRGLDRFEVDSKRRPKRIVERRAPQPGSRLILAIDADLQRYIAELMKGFRGAAVVIEPKTGEVLAMVSSPTFDTKLFEGGISSADYKSLLDDPATPLVNRATSGRYPPGSTFKIVTALASDLAGQFNPNVRVNCPGYYAMGARKTKCLGVHGMVSFHRAFVVSCNTYFATIGYRAGIDKLREAARICGMGEKTGIDLPSESSGIFPYEEWLNNRKKPLPWYPGDTVNVTIGQGYVAATPLQMANLAAFVANEGIIYRPHLVRGVIEPRSDPRIFEPEVLHQTEAPERMWSLLKSAMVDVVESGTAVSAKVPGLRWGAKTGSSEFRKGGKTHAWMIGIAPIDEPKLVFSIVLEGVGHGGDVAGPLAKSFLGHYFGTSAKALSASSKALESGARSDLGTPPADSNRDN